MNRPSGAEVYAMPSEPVVLIHGLWMPALAMVPLARFAGSAGHATRIFEYRGRSSFEANRARLAAYLRAQPGPVSVVAHSLGGVLALAALNGEPDLRVTAAVFLGSPVRGSLSGRRLAAWRAGRWLLGSAAEAWWNVREAAIWRHPAPLGVISGTAAWGLGRLLGPFTAANDGVVAAHETAVDGARDTVSVRTTHGGLLFSSAVARHVVRFLGRGSFQEG